MEIRRMTDSVTYAVAELNALLRVVLLFTLISLFSLRIYLLNATSAQTSFYFFILSSTSLIGVIYFVVWSFIRGMPVLRNLRTIALKSGLASDRELTRGTFFRLVGTLLLVFALFLCWAFLHH
jgi:hypothetical protein